MYIIITCIQIIKRRGHTTQVMYDGYQCSGGEDLEDIFWYVPNGCCGGGKIGVDFWGEFLWNIGKCLITSSPTFEILKFF